MIVAIGVSLVLENAMMLLTNGESVYLNLGINMTAGVMIGHVSVKWIQIILFAIAVVVMVGLTLLINYTKWGQAMRAVSEDMNTCRLMGINANRIIALTFIIGSMLAAVAGTMNGIYYGSLKYDMGYMMGIKAFTAAVIGGIGSIPGAMLGGILLGIIEILGKAYISTELGDAIVFAVLIIVLLVRPSGLLGKPQREKV
jgi:branched-chain amino acid transport system permease protein